MTTIQAFPGAMTGIDMEKATGFATRLMGDLGGAMTSLMCVLGDRLGLFRSLNAGGSATSAELATRTGLDERYLREWLHSLASAGYLEVDSTGQRFSLPPEHGIALASEGSPFSMGGALQLLPALTGMLAAVATAFESGGGVASDRYPPEFYEGMQRMSTNWLDTMLVQQWVPSVNGLEAKLGGGARVADVGCGRGRALILMAQAFPNSRFIGYDSFAANVEHARAAAREAGVATQVVFEHADAAHELPAGHDLVTAFNVLHDVADPAAMLRRVRGALEADGVFLLLESDAAERAADNSGPMATILYATSTLYCIPASLAHGGPALGTLGLPPGRVGQLCAEAGFTSVRGVPIASPFNALYEIRP